VKLANFKIAAIVALFLLLFGLVGHWDYEDAEAQSILYCENVKAGIWPDYEGTYKKFCKKSSAQRLTGSK